MTGGRSRATILPMGKNFTDLTRDEIADIVRYHFAARGRVVTDVNFAVTAAYDQETKKPTGYHELDGARVAWDEAKSPTPNPRTE